MKVPIEWKRTQFSRGLTHSQCAQKLPAVSVGITCDDKVWETVFGDEKNQKKTSARNRKFNQHVKNSIVVNGFWWDQIEKGIEIVWKSFNCVTK